MGLFGWSLPPGVSRLPGEEDHVCEICWHGEDDCICSPCGVCGEVGRSKCCQEHGMVLTQAQIESAKKAEEFYSQKAADEYRQNPADLRDGRLNRRDKIMKTENGTEGQPQVGCDAVFSPLAVCRESMQPGELYLWKRNKTVEVVKLNEPQDGFLVMGDDFPDYEEWYFDDELVGSLFGPVRLGENMLK